MYLTLLKVFAKDNFSIKRMFGFDPRKSWKKTVLVMGALIYGLGAFTLAFGWMAFDLGRVLALVNMTDLLLNYTGTYILGLSFMLALFRANGYMFEIKDYPILAPLPISSRTILAAKATLLLLTVYVFTAFISAPFIFSYFYWGNPSFIGVVYFVFGFFFIPLIPLVFTSFLSLIFAKISGRFSSSKYLRLIFLFVIFVGFFLWSFLPSANSVENPLLSQRGLMAWIGQYYFPLTWFVNGVSHSSFTDFLWVALTNGTVFVTFIFIAQSLFAKTNQQSLITVIAKYKKQYITKSQSVFWTLVIKEFRKLISTSLYAFNAAFGLVLMVLLAVVSLFSKTYLESMMVELAAVGLSPSIFILGFIGFCVAMSYSPAISLSLEGKNLWRLKSLPISAKTIMWSKILFNTFLVIPFAFLSWILFAISFNITIIDLLAILFLSVSFIFLSSVMDGVINLLFPRFDFVNDIEIIKTSLGALLGVFGGFGLMIINGVIFYFINPLLGSTLSYVCLGLIDSGLAFLASLYIEKKSEERFRTF